MYKLLYNISFAELKRKMVIIVNNQFLYNTHRNAGKL